MICYDEIYLREVKLYKIQDEEVTEVSGKPLKQEMLETDVR